MPSIRLGRPLSPLKDQKLRQYDISGPAPVLHFWGAETNTTKSYQEMRKKVSTLKTIWSIEMFSCLHLADWVRSECVYGVKKPAIFNM